MKKTREKIEKVISYHTIKDTKLAHLSEQFMEDILWLIEQEKHDFKKQLKAEIKYMLGGFKKSRFL